MMLFFLGGLVAVAAETGATKDERDLSKPLVVGAAEAFYPYSFRDKDGQVKGFAVDLLDAIARTMSLPIRREVMASTEFEGQLKSGEIDVVQFWSEVGARRAFADFSVPLAQFESVVVARKGEKRFKTFADLAGKRLAVGSAGNVSDQYVQSKLPGTIPYFSSTVEEFLGLMSRGEIDAALMAHATAVCSIDYYGFTNLQVLPIKINDCDVRFGIAVRKGETRLLARLNEGIAIVQRSGEFNEIYHRWFAKIEPRKFTPVQVMSYVAVALALACAAITWGLLRQRALNRRIAHQASELSAQRTLLTALHDNLPVALTVLERTEVGRIRFLSFNSKARQIHGIEPAAWVGHFVDEVPVPSEYDRYLTQVVASWPANEQIIHQEFVRSKQRLIDTTLVPLEKSFDGFARLCLFATDITDKRVEELDASRALRLRALGELVGGIAHEFNNLLTPIMLKACLMQVDHEHNQKIQEDVEVIRQAATRASDLTRRLLTFGRKNEDADKTSSVLEVVTSSAALLRPTFDRRIDWQTSLPEGLPDVCISSTDLNQVVFNLVINARDVLMAQLEQNSQNGDWVPSIQVSITSLVGNSPELPEPIRATAVVEGWQRLTVKDNGSGISPEVIDRIFEPFFTTKDAGKGTGLGLATVWHLLKDVGGYIYVDSILNVGTEFHVLLPISVVAAPAPVAPLPRQSVAPFAGLRILLAEDEDAVARAASGILKKLGHEVSHAPDGNQAWRVFSQPEHVFDLLLIDINMPHLSGVDLVRRIRATAYSGAIIVMSGRVDEADVEQLRQLGVRHLLPKPFTVDQLKSALVKAMSEDGISSSAPPMIG